MATPVKPTTPPNIPFGKNVNAVDYGAPYNFNGTPTPSADLSTTAQDGIYFEEDADSPAFELAEQATCVHSFSCDWSVTGLSIITTPSPYYRGQIFTDSFGDTYKILSTTVQRQHGNNCKVKIVTEATSYGLPPDEFSCDVLEFNPALQKHPRYAGLDIRLVAILNQLGVYGANPSQLAVARAAIDNSTYYSGLTPEQTAIKKAAAVEFLNKLHKGEETFYLAGYHVTHSQYFALPEQLNPGGYLEEPYGGGNLPVQFWSDTGQIGGHNIFTTLAAAVSPQFYTSGISWIRHADRVEYQRTWMKVTRSWTGGPAGGTAINGFQYYGHWDFDIYNPQYNPANNTAPYAYGYNQSEIL